MPHAENVTTRRRAAPLTTTSLTPRERAVIARMIAAQGERAAALALALPRHTLARACAGLGLRRGTVMVVRAALAAVRAE